MYGHLRLWLGSGLVIVGGLWLVDRLAPSADVPGVVATWWPVTMVMAGNAGTTLTSFCRAERPPS